MPKVLSSNHWEVIQVQAPANTTFPDFGMNAASAHLTNSTTPDTIFPHAGGALVAKGRDVFSNIWSVTVDYLFGSSNSPLRLVASADGTGDGTLDAFACNPGGGPFANDGEVGVFEGRSNQNTTITSSALSRITGRYGWSMRFCRSIDATSGFQGTNKSVVAIGTEGGGRVTLHFMKEGFDHRGTTTGSTPSQNQSFISATGSSGLGYNIKFSEDGQFLFITSHDESGSGSGAGRVYAVPLSSLNPNGGEEIEIKADIPGLIQFDGLEFLGQLGKNGVFDCPGFIAGYPDCIVIVSEDGIYAIGYNRALDADTTIIPANLSAGQVVKVTTEQTGLTNFSATTLRNTDTGVTQIAFSATDADGGSKSFCA